MDWSLFLIGIPFLVIGILFVLYANRFGRWWGIFSFEHRLNYFATKWKDEGLTREEFEKKAFNTLPHRFFWLFWLWGIRILGVMLAIGGLFVILEALSIL